MRLRLAVGAAVWLGLAGFVVFRPTPPDIPIPDQAAKHLSTYNWSIDAPWFGGLSGLELAPDGRTFYAVTDRARLIRGQLHRSDGQLVDVTVEASRELVDKNGGEQTYPRDDAEGLALDPRGRLYVSFEGQKRILFYDSWDSFAQWPSYTRAWRALGSNIALEAVAIDQQGVLYTVPEGVPSGAREALVYRRQPGQKWEQPFTLPLEGYYRPVGADFGPDGRLYLLEREFSRRGFRSRVRAFDVTDSDMDSFNTILETRHRDFGNLEGLSVWADEEGKIRLTMIADNNFLAILRTQIVEYVLKD